MIINVKAAKMLSMSDWQNGANDPKPTSALAAGSV
jgi:hypothetical protein